MMVVSDQSAMAQARVTYLLSKSPAVCRRANDDGDEHRYCARNAVSKIRPASPAAPAPNHLRKRGFLADVSVTVIMLLGDANGKMTFVRVSCRSLKLTNGRSFVPWCWINFYICYVRIIYAVGENIRGPFGLAGETSPSSVDAR